MTSCPQGAAAVRSAANAAARIPAGRLGQSEEVAQATLMVLSNAYITGQTIHLNGGMSFN